MTWETILPQRGSRTGRQMAPVMVGMTKGGKMRLTVTAAEAERLGWKLAMRLAPMHGTGEHAGKLRVAPSAGGFSLGKPAPKSNRLDIVWPAPAGVAQTKHPPEAVQHRKVADQVGCIEIDLPEWATPPRPVQRGFVDHPKALPAQPVTKRIA